MFQRAIVLSVISAVALASAVRADQLVRINFTFATGPGPNGTGVTTVTDPVYLDIYATPAITANNFLSYVTSNAYTDSFIHRSVPGFVIQGGGFKFAGPTSLADVATNAPIALQYTVANTRGTIAMARTSDPNSATSQWFINTADNSATLAPGGSDPNGYAVFGSVLNAASMAYVDTIASIPNYDASKYIGGVYTQLPLTQPTLAYDYFVHVADVVSLAEIGDINHDGKVTIDDILAFDASILNPRNRDVNGDGIINADDGLLSDYALAHGTSAWGVNNYATGWALGDFNLDGSVDGTDYQMLINAYRQDNPNAPLSDGDVLALNPFAVPEPASLAILCGVMPLCFCRRRSHRRR